MEGQPPLEQTTEQEQSEIAPELAQGLGQVVLAQGDEASNATSSKEAKDFTEPEPEIEPRIYVADLRAYNAGVLRGVWVDAAQDAEELEDFIGGWMAHTPSGRDGEWAIHDFEGFNGLNLGEWENLAYVSKIAKGIKENGLAYAHWATLVATDEELDQFEDAYLGHWPDLKSYAEDVLQDLGAYEQVEKAVSDHLKPYVTIDAEGFASDLELGGDVMTAEAKQGGVYVYSHQ